MPVVWQDAMSVGNKIIDDEHKYLFCLINSVEVALKLEDNRSILKQLLAQLQEYTRSHFEQEEAIQRKIKYPACREHQQEHQQILDNIADLSRQLLADKPVDKAALAGLAAIKGVAADDELSASVSDEIEDYDPYGSEPQPAAKPSSTVQPSVGLDAAMQQRVVGLLRDWVLEHVLQSDMRMKKYLQRLPSNFA